MPTLQAHELDREIRTGSFRPVYVLVGPEEFLRRLASDSLKRGVVPESAAGFNRSEFSANEHTVSEILSAARTFPFGCPRRLVIVRDLEAMTAEAQADLISYLQDPSPKTVLVLIAEDLDRRFSFYRTLREQAAMIEFPLLKGPRLEKWAEEYISGQGYRMSTTAVRKLTALAGSDVQSLVGEIEKLMIYAGDEKTIPQSAVDDMVAASRQHTVFELTDAIGRHDRQGALRLLANLLDSDESPFGIVAMIARHFRQILIAKEMLDAGRKSHEIAAGAQIPPFVLDELLRQARGFDRNAARCIFLGLAEADLRLKSSSIDPRLILEKLICHS